MPTKVITIQQKVNFLVNVNIFLLVEEQVVIVDTGVRDSYKLILQKLEELQIDKQSASLILVTHSHPDHCLGIKNLKKHFDVPVATTELEAPYLKKGEFSPVVPLNPLGWLVYGFLRQLHAKHDDYIEPDIEFDKELNLKPFGISGKAVLTPGHSIGGCSVILDDGKCILGDLVIEDVLIKKPRINLFASDLSSLKKSLQTIITPEITNIYTSHGKCWATEKIKKRMDRLINV
jgi:glyoxylase-like metal-dependent hydrolase (beta-lactamase superfamily II)